MTPKADNKLMLLLKVQSISHLLARTSLGDLTMNIAKGENKYLFHLDAVPVDKEAQEFLEKVYGTMPNSAA